MRVLAVDDDDAVRYLIRRILERVPEVELSLAAGGAEAIDLIDAGELYDVILIDVTMPDMSGMDVVEWMKLHQPALVARVGLVTAGAADTPALDFLRRTGLPVLYKPFTPNELSAFVHRLA